VSQQQSTAPLVSYHGGHSLTDGEGEPERFVEAAIEKGFVGLGFSEHMPLPPRYAYPASPEWAILKKNFDGYVETIRKLQETYRADLSILVGIEAEYLPDEEAYLSGFLDEYAFDYVVGSVHFVAGIGFDYSQEFYDQAVEACGSYEGLAVEYYRTVRGLLAMGVTDVLGHLDLIDIFSPKSISGPQVREAEDETLEAAKRANAILDVNARGLIKPVQRVYPRVELLRRACELKIPATLGDDSHAPDQVGAHLEHSVAAMRAAGYTSIEALLLKDDRVVRQALPL
jgi:histidinol-phosphatase (PHP family)